MRSFKNILTSLILLLLLSNAVVTAQSIQRVNPSNMTNSANEIKKIFGDLVGVSEQQIIDFYDHHWTPATPYNVAVPSPSGTLTNINDSLVDFEWSMAGPPPQNGYRISTLRLSDGFSETNTTTGTSMTLDLEKSIYLTVIQSHYSSGKSELDIIIIERIMFYTGCPCDCQDFYKVWDSSFSQGNPITSYEWEPQSTFEIYQYEISYSNPVGVHASFRAMIEFNDNHTPIAVQLDESSMVNFSFNNNADQSFLYSHLPEGGISEILGPITFSQDPDYPDTNLPLLSYYVADNFEYPNQAGKVKLSKCKKRSRVRSNHSENKNTSNNTNQAILKEVSNSFASNKTIEYQLTKDQSVSIYLMDNQGRFMSAIVNNTPKEKGTYQFHLDLSTYAKGSYFCILKTSNDRIPLQLLNIK